MIIAIFLQSCGLFGGCRHRADLFFFARILFFPVFCYNSSYSIEVLTIVSHNN